MKAFLIPFVIIATSFFYFPFYFTFLPTVNTKMMLAALGLAILLVRLGRGGQGQVSKEFFLLSLYAAGVSLASLLAMTWNNSIDGAYLGYVVTMWVWVGAAYCVVNLIRGVHGRATVELVCFYMIAVGALQCVLAMSMERYAPLKEFVDSFLYGEGFMGKFEGRLYGIGCALDVAGGRMAVLLVMTAFLLPRMFEKENYKLYVVPLLAAFCIIAVIGNMIGRTASVGMVMGLLYLACVMFVPNRIVSGERRKLLSRWVIVVMAVAVAFSVFLYNWDEGWYKFFRFGFEGFFSLAEKGRWEVTSNQMLVNGMVFPDTFKTWVIGDGYMGSMAEDPYYIGEQWYGYYMGTDAGYSRFLFYFGIIGMGAFLFFMFNVCRACMRRSVRYKYMFLAMLVLNLGIWVKVSTDIFLAFAPFLCLDVEDDGPESEKR